MFSMRGVALVALFNALNVLGRIAVCETALYPVVLHNATILDLSPIPIPPNDIVLTGILTPSFAATSSTPAFNTTTLTTAYNISGTFCRPEKLAPGATLHFAVHGFGFGGNYWDVGYQPGNYSYAEYVASQGDAIFFYDRLGVGKSSTPANSVLEVQAFTNLVVAHTLIQTVRATFVKQYGIAKVVGVGHSYGSIQLVGVTANFPDDLDELVLTGFSASTASTNLAGVGFGLRIANAADPTRFSKLSNGYLLTGGASNDQTVFLSFPNFDPAAFEWAEANKQSVSLGEFVTLTALVAPAPKFTGRVLVISGEEDFIFCGGNCTQSYPGTNATLLQAAQALYPAASHFATEICEGSAHAMNIHYTAPATYWVIYQFLMGKW